MKLHLGCGWRDFGKDWIHIDDGDYEHVDYKSDVSDLQMIETNSVDVIYASHVIAYFDREEMVDVLTEWNRVLKSGGVLRVATPDFESMVHLYLQADYPLNSFVGPLYGKMSMGDSTIYHKTTYDFHSIRELLEDNGFASVQKYDWRDTEHSEFDDHSQAYIPHMDKENGTLISLNVECKKR